MNHIILTVTLLCEIEDTSRPKFFWFNQHYFSLSYKVMWWSSTCRQTDGTNCKGPSALSWCRCASKMDKQEKLALSPVWRRGSVSSNVLIKSSAYSSISVKFWNRCVNDNSYFSGLQRCQYYNEWSIIYNVYPSLNIVFGKKIQYSIIHINTLTSQWGGGGVGWSIIFM